MTPLLKMSSIPNSQVTYNIPFLETSNICSSTKSAFLVSIWIFREILANELKWFLYETETTFLLDNLEKQLGIQYWHC